MRPWGNKIGIPGRLTSESADRGEQRVPVVPALAGAQVGDAGRAVHLVQQVSDAHARHYRLFSIREGAGLRCEGCLDRRHMQALVMEFDTP